MIALLCLALFLQRENASCFVSGPNLQKILSNDVDIREGEFLQFGKPFVFNHGSVALQCFMVSRIIAFSKPASLMIELTASSPAVQLEIKTSVVLLFRMHLNQSRWPWHAFLGLISWFNAMILFSIPRLVALSPFIFDLFVFVYKQNILWQHGGQRNK